MDKETYTYSKSVCNIMKMLTNMKNVLAKMSLIGTLIFSLNTASVQAQPYGTALGLRIAEQYGITLKHFTSEHSALEGIARFSSNGFNVTGLYEYHGNAFNAKGLSYLIGGGAFAGSYNHAYYYDRGYKGNDATVVFGLAGILGLDYKFENAPINLQLDWIPSIGLVPNYFEGAQVGLSVRYVFNDK